MRIRDRIPQAQRQPRRRAMSSSAAPRAALPGRESCGDFEREQHDALHRDLRARRRLRTAARSSCAQLVVERPPERGLARNAAQNPSVVSARSGAFRPSSRRVRRDSSSTCAATARPRASSPGPTPSRSPVPALVAVAAIVRGKSPSLTTIAREHAVRHELRPRDDLLPPCGGFQRSSIDALFSLNLKCRARSRIRTRPPSRKIVFFSSRTSGPGLTHASMSMSFGSFTHSRAPFSVFTMNSYMPVSGAISEPSQRIENRPPASSPNPDFPPRKRSDLRIHPIEYFTFSFLRTWPVFSGFFFGGVISRALYCPRSPRSPLGSGCRPPRKVPIRSAIVAQYQRVSRAISSWAGRNRVCAAGE